MKLVIVSGLSGAGKTVALKQFEDLGWYCIDNIPLALIDPMLRRALSKKSGKRYERLAIGIDARETAAQIRRFPNYLAKLRDKGIDVRVLFLTADDDVIMRRYSETRRKHPLSSAKLSLLEAIQQERKLMQPIANFAEEPLDTSHLNLHEAREAVYQRLSEAGGKLSVLFLSFGFKNGIPSGCDYIFDVRCLPNPHWEPGLRQLTGRDAKVETWLKSHTPVTSMIDDIARFLETWLPAFRAQDRAYLTIAIGCTGGQHRSVYIVERLAERFGAHTDQVMHKHRELQ
ncbi:MAG: rapZ [Hydrocarboniphaga sp.]|uniref:RNase adapter RapZ n=1 Tax=Hydrocarboniphaga sp. TaxID=2033016 RepID=UPI0026156959|nr:RNase adapter RapZ [Hydrocarboniphaga sp.]MDB5969587.1 rapZ [Hydrocarboniphaga sp.]